MNEAVSAAPSDRKWKAVYTIVERQGSDRQGNADRKFWVRVGTAWVNRDQSLNVHLDAAPTNGTLHIRDYEPFQERGDNRGGARNSGGRAAMGGVQ